MPGRRRPTRPRSRWTPPPRPVRGRGAVPRGVVGQWYPAPESFLPAIHDMKALAGGAMTWQLTLDPAVTPASFPPVSPDEIWAPSRRVSSTPVRFTSPDGVEE